MAYTVTDSVQKIWQALFRPLVDHFLPQISPTWKDIQTQGGRSAFPEVNGIGLDWKVIWPFEIGMAGAAEFAPIAGPDIATNPATPAPPDFGALLDTETWPGMLESTIPTFFQKTITLKRIKGNVHIPFQLMQLAQIKPAMVADPVEGIIRGWGRRLSHTMCAGFFAQADNLGTPKNVCLGSFTAVTGDGLTINTTGIPVHLDPAGTTYGVANSIARFGPGMRVDVYLQGSDTRLNTLPVFVGKCRGYNRTATYAGHITLYSPYGNACTLTNGYVYHLTLRNCGKEAATTTSYLPTCLKDLIKTTSGTIFGINVASYPQFQSVSSSTAMVPTEVNISKYLAEQEQFASDLNDESMKPDTFLMTPGVMARFFQDAQASHLRIVNSGQALDMSGGVKAEINYTLFDREYTFKSERWLPQKYGLICKMKNNWQVVRPPRIPKAGSNPAIDPGFEFLAPLWGNNSIFMHAPQVGGGTSAAFTGMGQAPCQMIYEVLPKSFGGWFEFTNLTEAYIS